MLAINTYKRIYVWESPVRVFHWSNAFSMVVLAITGILIANPPAIMSGSEASNQQWFGLVRTVHFLAAYLFMFGMIYRVIWSLVGNKYSNWRVFFPFTKKGMRNLVHVLKIDILLQNPRQFNFSDICVGHNSLAALSYMFLFLMMIVQVCTGFALYADQSTWWFPNLFGWVVPLLGGDAEVRIVHHAIMWMMIMFVVIHVYLVMYHDWLERRAEVSSMFGGYKYVRSERVKPEEETK